MTGEYRRAFKGQSCFLSRLPSDINLSSHLTHVKSLECLTTTGFSHSQEIRARRSNTAPLTSHHEISKKTFSPQKNYMDFCSSEDETTTSNTLTFVIYLWMSRLEVKPFWLYWLWKTHYGNSRWLNTDVPRNANLLYLHVQHYQALNRSHSDMF